MEPKAYLRPALRSLGAGAALAACAYVSYVSVAWGRYGKTERVSQGKSRDVLLERFIPGYEVAERHQVRVAAPVEITFRIACGLNLQDSTIVRAIFKARELVFRGDPAKDARWFDLVDQAKAWGWRVLAEEPGREIVFGAVTQPWLANPVFRGLPPDEFASFHEPGYAKIAWMLRADPIDGMKSLVSSETRVATTDPVSREKFRCYWALLSPGILLIRWVSLRLVRAEAERLAHGKKKGRTC